MLLRPTATNAASRGIAGRGCRLPIAGPARPALLEPSTFIGGICTASCLIDADRAALENLRVAMARLKQFLWRAGSPVF